MERQQQLPVRTDDLNPPGGEIKRTASDFVVEEIPLYQPEDDGQHLYVRTTREGKTTREIVDALAGLFDLPPDTIGYAGLKDKRARATQTFSLDTAEFERPKPTDDQVAERIQGELDIGVRYARRHRNKLRRGHLVGNQFRVALRDCEEGPALERAREIADALLERGVPNFYGAQRFGRDGENAERGLGILRTGDFDGPYWKRRLMLNAYQSRLFNRWLVDRIERDAFGRLFRGDIAKKTDTGGLFEVEDLDREQERFQNREITFTGPVYGSDLWWASDEAGEIEEQILEDSAVGIDALEREGLSGSRRRGRIHLESLEVESLQGGELALEFTLPKGAYATVVLREFV